ncbi:2-C-methyl-D-erythritol 4-phosphate cytidylyltransferase / 2-C-methyl-D-erythritol 2,4-cyclodiphosphate synthase [Candidatus Planktophila limnetica]|uniref:Bifunctional enzyme IspD/IspF n=1 Tax=Candidatus Planktophila limnetica TaxID=573600 RepID=A0A249LDS0_9ACTN|nr:2-C-methyl-D-erythritol 4-phosphate cytidylyltransferase [Candidatus Planktophila limnetica]ASY27213.1 2-C-methyl-D-erythritol 4-phosphate cytidylyltransferase / 2-C-methyl-D-erythritol 2,4-cyclodiphosphate synthase [Candidatus Planktophila limnetica]
MSQCAAIIAAAGSGERFGATLPKALITLGNRTLIEHAVAALAPIASEIVICAPAGYEKQIQELVGADITVVTGGTTRSDSVRAGIAALTGKNKYVLVHDAARALASTQLAKNVLAALEKGEVAIIPGLELIDTVKSVDAGGHVTSTPDRASLRRVQTPQGFDLEILKKAHSSGANATDDGALVEAIGHKVLIINGEDRALKITTPADLATALSTLGDSSEFRTGVGVDAHAFEEGRELWLAGLHWPNEVGVAGHSDGDVAAHAICDALFAAGQLGDLGSNFGTDKPEYAGASGVTLLKETMQKISSAGYSISNVTVQIIGNRPKLTSRRSEAIATLSAALGGANVSVLATTTDGMGLTGEGRGIAAIASALLIKQG